MNNLNVTRPILITTSKEETYREDMLDILRCSDSIMKALTAEGYNVEILHISPSNFYNLNELASIIRDIRPLCIFNLFEGFSDNPNLESKFAEILETLDIPFTGNPSETLARCLNKATTKKFLKSNGIEVPLGVVIKKPLLKPLQGLDYPLFTKPCCEDGSLGIDSDSFIESESELIDKLGIKLLNHPSGVIVEEFIPGREFNIGFLGNTDYEVLSVSVLDYSKYRGIRPFLSYSAKWDSNSLEYGITFKELDHSEQDLREKIIEIGCRCGVALGCKGYFRVDIREKNGKLYVLDVNPNPDINVDSGFARQGQAAGYSYTSLLKKIIDLAIEEKNERSLYYETLHLGVY